MAALLPGWTQSNWAPAGMPFTGYEIRCLFYDEVEDVLWVGGDIRDGFQSWQKVLLKYDGVNWTSYGYFDGSVVAITRFQNKIVIGGFFNEYNGTPCERIAFLDGNDFVQIDGGANGSVTTLQPIGDTLYVGGSFDFIGTIDTQMAAKYDGQNWHSLNFPAAESASVVSAFLKFDNDLFIGGNFNPFEWWDTGESDIVFREGNSWQPAGGGISGSISDVRSIVEYNGELIIGGAIYKSAGNAGHSIQKWNAVNQTWEELGGSLTGEDFSTSDFCPVKDIDLWNNKLYIWGSFTNAGDIYSPYITVWDGEKYCWPGGNFTGYGPGSELEFFHDTLYVACGDSVDGQFTNNLAKYVGDWEFLNCSTVGVENNNPDDRIADISLFPNPATSIIHLRNLPSGKLFTVKIYDALGRVVTSFKNKTEVDVSTLTIGIYFLKVEWEGGQVVRSFVKE